MSCCTTPRLKSAALIALIVWIAGVLPAFTQTRQIVLLFDERTDLPGLAMLDAGFVRGLASELPGRVEIYREAMDLSRFDSDAYRTLLRNHLRAKYAARKIDVIVAVMEPALDFLLDHRDEVFPGAPVVFCGIDRRRLDGRTLPSDVTGVLLKREFSPTLELALSLHPETDRIVVVAGKSEFDARLLAQAREEFRPFEGRLAFTYLTELPLPELLSQLSQLPPKTIVLYSTVFRDGAGKPFVPHEVAERISAAANAPVYGFLDQYLGRGIVGGRLYGLGAHGEAASGMVARILAGTRPSELSLIEPVNSVTAFDWQQLQRWDIDESRLPPGATIRFRAPSLWSEYKYYLIGGLLVIVAQTGTIAGLLAYRARRRSAEAEVRESEARFRGVADAAPVMIWMSGTDRLCNYFNKGWLRFTGRALEQELGNGWAEGVHADDRAGCLKTYIEAFDARRDFAMEYRLRRYDGEYRWVSDIGVPRFDSARRFLGYIGSCVDLTERKRADEKFRLAVEASPNGIVLVNAEGRMVLVNVHIEELFGYARKELIGQTVEMLLPERFRHAHVGHRAGFFTAPQTRAMGARRDLFARRKDGTEFPVEIGLSTIQSEGGILILTAIVDITARKQSEQEIAQQRNQLTHLSRVTMLGELSGSLAHELNQPLTAILCNAQAAQRFLAQDKVDLDELRHILKDIVDEDKRAGEVIRRLRLLLKKGEVQRQPLDVNATVQEILKLARSDLVIHGVTAKTELAPDLPMVYADRVQLQQVLLNLVMNACDAMRGNADADRQLIVHTEQAEGACVRISVSDRGSGIPADKVEQVFEPFFTTKSHGMGLGLSICRTIVESHRGRIWAENNASGGATFRVRLPVTAADEHSYRER